MDTVLRAVNLGCSGIALILTVLALVTYGRERRLQPVVLLLSAALSLIMLPLFVLITGARLSILIAIPLLLMGALWGMVRALTVRMYHGEERVMGRNSMLSLAGWGGSYALAILMNSFDSALLASLGLAPLCVATGTQVVLNGTLLLRRLLLRRLFLRASI